MGEEKKKRKEERESETKKEREIAHKIFMQTNGMVAME